MRTGDECPPRTGRSTWRPGPARAPPGRRPESPCGPGGRRHWPPSPLRPPPPRLRCAGRPHHPSGLYPPRELRANETVERGIIGEALYTEGSADGAWVGPRPLGVDDAAERPHVDAVGHELRQALLVPCVDEVTVQRIG